MYKKVPSQGVAGESMDVMEVLDNMREKAISDQALYMQILRTLDQKSPYDAFCALCRENGYDIYPLDLAAAGEEMYAAIKRSTNGGGENSPMLEGEDDLYRMFMDEIKSYGKT